MKNIKFLHVFFAIMLLPSFFSCSSDNEDNYKPQSENLPFKNSITVANTILSISELEAISSEVKVIQNTDPKNEEKLAKALTPLVENGKAIIKAMLAEGAPNDISPKDYSYIANEMTNMELAQLSFTTSIIINYPEYETHRWNSDQVWNCLGAALGINEVYGLIQNTKELIALGGEAAIGQSANALAWKAAKLIIRRYVGWIGVAVAVYSFTNCMNG